MSPEGSKALIRRWYEESGNQRNLDALDELYAPTWVGHFPGAGELRGPTAHKQLLAAFSAAFPDAQYTVEDILAEGDRVASRYTVRGTHRGALSGIPPTGKAIVSTGINIHRIADGKIAEQWAEYDMLGLLQQLGVVPSPG